MSRDGLVLRTAPSGALHGLVSPRRRLLSGGRVDGQTAALAASSRRLSYVTNEVSEERERKAVPRWMAACGVPELGSLP